MAVSADPDQLASKSTDLDPHWSFYLVRPVPPDTKGKYGNVFVINLAFKPL